MSGRLLRELRIKRSLKVMGVEVSGLRAPESRLIPKRESVRAVERCRNQQHRPVVVEIAAVASPEINNLDPGSEGAAYGLAKVRAFGCASGCDVMQDGASVREMAQTCFGTCQLQRDACIIGRCILCLDKQIARFGVAALPVQDLSAPAQRHRV